MGHGPYGWPIAMTNNQRVSPFFVAVGLTSTRSGCRFVPTQVLPTRHEAPWWHRRTKIEWYLSNLEMQKMFQTCFFFQLETRIAVSDMLFSETNLGGLSLSVSGGDLCSLQIIMFTPGFHGGIMG